MFGRRLRRTAAPLLLLAWIGGLALPALSARHASVFDDPACERPLASSNHSGSQIDKNTAPRGNGHCGICHLQRAVRGALHSAVQSAIYADAITLDRALAVSDLVSTEHALSSSRAPPSNLVIA